MSSIGQMWHAAFMLLSGLFLAGGAPAPGCNCLLNECCTGNLDAAAELPEGPTQGWSSQQKIDAPPPACELLAFSKNTTATCSKEGTICSAIEDDVKKEFPDEGVLLRTAMGRFIGPGTCGVLSLTSSCTAMKAIYVLGVHQWRRVELLWEDTSETINVSGLTSQLQLEETCDSNSALNVKATVGEQAAGNVSISEGDWEDAGDNSSLQWVCVDINAPGQLGIPVPYHALYLKAGGVPCKSVPGLDVSGPLAMLKRSLLILILVGLVCCVCCCIVLVLICCRPSGGDEDEEEEDSDEEFMS